MKERLSLDDVMSPCGVIRATFETFDLFPVDDPIRLEMQEIIHDARATLITTVQTLCDTIDTTPDVFDVNYGAFRDWAMRLITRGYSGRNLNRMMKVNVFDEGESSLYYFEIAGLVDVNELRQEPPQRFTVLVFNELLRAAGEEENYTDKQQFDRKVFQKFLAVMFILYATTDPMFYGF